MCDIVHKKCEILATISGYGEFFGSLPRLTWTGIDVSEAPAPRQNHLLLALPAEVQDRLFPHLELIPLPLGKVLYESGDTLEHVYFPTDSIVVGKRRAASSAEHARRGLIG